MTDFFNDTFDNFSFTESGQIVQNNSQANPNGQCNQFDNITIDDSTFLSETFSFTENNGNPKKIEEKEDTLTANSKKSNSSNKTSSLSKQSYSKLNITVHRSPLPDGQRNQNNIVETPIKASRILPTNQSKTNIVNVETATEGKTNNNTKITLQDKGSNWNAFQNVIDQAGNVSNISVNKAVLCDKNVEINNIATPLTHAQKSDIVSKNLSTASKINRNVQIVQTSRPQMEVRNGRDKFVQMNIATPVHAQHSPSASKLSVGGSKNGPKEILKAVENEIIETPKRSLFTENKTSTVKKDTFAIHKATETPKKYEFSQTETNKLAHWGLPNAILQKYESRNIIYMFPWQIECLTKPGVLEKHKNLVYSAPTSAGKTLVAEILAIKTVLERHKKVIFILPYVSVVREKMFYFQDIFGASGVRVEGFMGSYNPPGGFRPVQVAICTIEKANSLVNWLLEEGNLSTIGAIIVDEMHLLGDPHRGYLLELMLTKVRYMSLKEELVNIQIIGMSATLPNLSLLADWLDAELYTTNFRPIPLCELCHVHGEIYNNNLTLLRKLTPIPELTDTDNILQLCLETITTSCSVLIFCPTKNWCESLSQQIAQAFWKLGSGKTDLGVQLRNELNAELITECLEQLKNCPVGLDSILGKAVSFGVAFHHAGLTMDERDIIEGAFRNGCLRVLIATSTLSAGVNLPARRVIIRTPMFYGKPLDTLVYRQMIGRAGRMGRDVAGESILICQKNDSKVARELMSAHLQPIESCLEGAGKLKRAILEVITSNVAASPSEIGLFTRCTLLASDNSNRIELNNPIDESVDFLIDNEFIRLQKLEDGNSKYVATSLAKACLSSSLPPEEGLALFAELEKARQCFVLETELHLIYLVTPYSACNQIGSIDWMLYLDLWEKLPGSMKRVGDLVGVRVSYIINGTRGKIQTNTSKLYHKFQIHRRFYTALVLQDLVNEVPLTTVASKFNCNRGMLQSLQQSAATFAGMVTSFSRQLGWSSVEILISQFQDRLQFGISRELLDLMRLPTLNGQRARALFNAGIETLVDLASSEVCALENILHKSLPFESEKEREGEGEYEAKKRNKVRNVWISGKQGLTERETAVLLIDDARKYLQYELGLKDAQWETEQDVEKSFKEVDSSEVGEEVNSKGVVNGKEEEVECVEVEEIVSEEKVVEVDVEKSDEIIVENETVISAVSDRSLKNYEIDDCDSSLEQNFSMKPPREVSKLLSISGNSLEMSFSFSSKENSRYNLRSSSSGKPNVSISLETTEISKLALSLGEIDLARQENPSVNEVIDNSIEDVFGDSFDMNSKLILNLDQIEGAAENEHVGSESFLEKAFMSSFDLDEKCSTPPKSDNKENVMNSVRKRNRCRRSNNSEDDLFDSTPMKKSRLSQRRQSFQATCVVSPEKPTRKSLSNNFEETPEKKRNENSIPKGDVGRSFGRDLGKLKKFSPEVDNKENLETPGRPVQNLRRSLKEKQNINGNGMDKSLVIDVEEPPVKEVVEQIVVTPNNKKQVSSLELINVCDDKEIFANFSKELLQQTTISMSLGCEKIIEPKPIIGHKILGKTPLVSPTKKYSFKSRKVTGISVTWKENVVYYINLDKPDVITSSESIKLLRKLFANQKLLMKMFDAKEQIKVLKRCCDIDFDAQAVDPKIGDWLLEPEEREKDLEDLCEAYGPRYLNLCKKAGVSKGYGSLGLEMDSSVEAKVRSCIESAITLVLVDEIKKVLEEQDSALLNTYDVEMNCGIILSRMELVGFGVDTKRLQSLSENLKSYTMAIETKAYQLSGKRFSFTSPTEVAKIIGIYKGRKVSTSKQVLENSTHPISDLIIQWRKINSTLTKMIYPLLRLVENNRIYGCCITRNATGRISMHEPNLQNMPRDFEFVNPITGKVVNISCRSAFVPQDKNVLISADYCQLELRLLAHLSQDKLLCKIMKSNNDVFKLIAAKWNNILEDEVTESIRHQAKQICYGIIYGMGVRTLADNLCVTEEEAMEFTETFHQTYPGIRKYIAEVVGRCRENGFVETLAGRKRFLPNISSTNGSVKSQAERQAVNTTIQGSAADIVKNAMVLMENKIKDKFRSSRFKPKLILHMHDELVYEVSTKYVNVLAKIVQKSMQSSVKLSVPFPVKLKAGNSWGEMEELMI